MELIHVAEIGRNGYCEIGILFFAEVWRRRGARPRLLIYSGRVSTMAAHRMFASNTFQYFGGRTFAAGMNQFAGDDQ